MVPREGLIANFLILRLAVTPSLTLTLSVTLTLAAFWMA